MASSKLHLALLLFAAFMLLAQEVTASNSRPPRNKDIANMVDALKYLQDLDVYYGDRARVRFGKRTMLTQLMRNHLNDHNPGEVVPSQQRTADLLPEEEPF